MNTKSKSIKVGVIGILANDEGKILLGRRVKDDPSFPGLWCIPGGGVEFGETYDDALRREFMEEVGLKVTPNPTVLSVEQRIIRNERHTLLICKTVTGLPNRRPIAGDGFDKVGYFSIPELQWMRKKLTPLTITAIEEYCSQLVAREMRRLLNPAAFALSTKMSRRLAISLG